MPSAWNVLAPITNISRIWDKGDPSSFTNQGNKYKPGDIATEGVGGKQDSLTQFIRSLQNYTALTGKEGMATGQGMVQQATGDLEPARKMVSGAYDTTGTALDTTNKALSNLAPAQDYWSKILSGDQGAINQAIAPYATQVGTNYANAATTAQQNMPRGGYSAALTAGMPFAQARDVNTKLMELQPTAATNLGQLSEIINQIGGTQTGIANARTGAGQAQSQIANILGNLGLNTQQIAEVLLGQSGNLALGRRNQNYQVDMNNINNLRAGLSSLMGDISAGYGAAAGKKPT